MKIQSAQDPQESGIPSYAVDTPPQGPPLRKVAVFVAHGMGQQVPFQTLDQVAEGLRQVDAGAGNQNPKPIARTLKSGDQWLRRIELQLKANNEAVEAHVYEGYWAPLTEGKISTKGVIRFLVGAGKDGLKKNSGQFKRWMFNEYRDYPTPIRTVIYLLVALATIAALVGMNSAIAGVAAGRALLAQTPGWLTDGLFSDLTTTFNAVVTIMAGFGLSLFVAHLARRLPHRLRQIWGWVTVVLFDVTVSLVILAGFAIAVLFYGHVRGGVAADAQLWYQVFSPKLIDSFNSAFDWAAWRLGIVVASGFAAWWIGKILIGLIRDFFDPPGRWLTLLVTAAFGVIIGSTVWLILVFFDALKNLHGGEASVIVASGLAWPLLIAASAYIRRILIQYVGDVAIYITAHTLDAFNDVRKEIRTSVHAAAHAVYAQPEYKDVVVIGHSLGSVIVYDALNQLINEDISSAKPLDVVGRTSLLLTFGSPLDKTAFIFGMQSKDTSEAREALAASVQPLIRDYKYRPKQWINIYSPWDIISGSLGLYDSPDGSGPQRVQNLSDPDATTLLAAHTEYWRNPLLFQTIYAAL